MHRKAIDETWMSAANCVGTDPEAWFPGKGGRLSGFQKRVCDACPVREACLEYALEFRLGGIWGGTTEIERRTMRRASKVPLTG